VVNTLRYLYPQAGALDILQSPISEQADRLHFLAAKWQHTLQPTDNTNFSADCGDSVQQSFSMSLAHMPPMVSCKSNTHASELEVCSPGALLLPRT
jgi:hypothetical protein